MSILWWHWLALGLVLALAEMAAAGGFFIIFFGIAALIVGLLALAGVAGPLWMQILLFSVLSVASLVLFRARVVQWLQADPQAPPVDAVVGEVGVTTQTLMPGAVGQVELRGTMWPARNVSANALVAGERVRVVNVHGLTVDVQPEGAR